MGVVHGKVGDDDGDGEGDGEHAADCAQAAHDHAQVSLDDGGERRRSDGDNASRSGGEFSTHLLQGYQLTDTLR